MQSVNEHPGCHNYEGNRPAIRQPIVEMKNIRKNGVLQFYATRYELFFLLAGKVQTEVGIKDESVVDKGYFRYASQGDQTTVRALTNSTLIVIRTELDSLCECYSFERLYADFKDKDLERPQARKLYATLMRPSLWRCLIGLFDTMTDGLLCSRYFNLKINEIFLLLRLYYTKQELYFAFHHTLTGDISFSEGVKNLWRKCKTVSERARMMNYTPSGFYKRFTSVFDTSPQKWLQAQKESAVVPESHIV